MDFRNTSRIPGSPTNTILKADPSDRFPAFLAFRGYRRRLRRHRRRHSSTVGRTTALTTGRRTKRLLPAPTSPATSEVDTAARRLILHHTAGTHVRRTTEHHDALRNRLDSNRPSFRQYTDVRDIKVKFSREVRLTTSPLIVVTATTVEHHLPSFVPTPILSVLYNIFNYVLENCNRTTI